MTIIDLPFAKYTRKLKAKPFVLPEDLYLEQWIVPKGVEVKLATSRDFGTVVLPEGTRDKRGFIIRRRIFTY